MLEYSKNPGSKKATFHSTLSVQSITSVAVVTINVFSSSRSFYLNCIRLLGYNKRLSLVDVIKCERRNGRGKDSTHKLMYQVSSALFNAETKIARRVMELIVFLAGSKNFRFFVGPVENLT